MEIRDKIIEIISSYCNIDDLKGYLENNDDLSVFGINSISFIKMVIIFENDFKIEFDDEALSFTNFHSFNALHNYILSLMNNRD